MPITTSLTGKSIAITGKLSKERAYMERDINLAGGLFHASVTSKTDYLVVGGAPGRTKVNAANYNGTRKISEELLRDLMKPTSTSSAPVALEEIRKGKLDITSFFGEFNV